MKLPNGLNEILLHLKPHKTVPQTPWRAKHRWDLSFNRVLILFFGLTLFGIGDAFVVQSNIGNAPWTVFAQGLSLKSGLTLGWATFFTGCAVLLLWIPLRERPGFGTLANIAIISASIQFGVDHLPLQTTLLGGVASALFGIALDRGSASRREDRTWNRPFCPIGWPSGGGFLRCSSAPYLKVTTNSA